MMTQLRIESLSDVHRVLSAMLRWVHNVAERESLTYVLAYGTALGAVRDRSLIPWDTDGDILVPIEELSQLVSSLRADDQVAFEVTTAEEAGYEHLFPRISVRGLNHNLLHVDLFPLAGAANRHVWRRVEIRLAKLLCMTHMIKVANPAERYFYSAPKLRIARALRALVSIIPRSWIEELFAFLSRRATVGAKYVFNVAGSYGDREILSANLIAQRSRCTLDGEGYWAPGDVDTYLRQTYGDYLTPPDESTRSLAVGFFEEHFLPRIRGTSIDLEA